MHSSEITQTEDPDRELVRQAQAGSVEAFTVLARKLQTRVYRFILRQIPIAADADDLAQETFLEAFRHLSSFQGRARFSSWVMGIALNLVRNHRNRAPEAKHTQVSDDVLSRMPDEGANPHRDMQTRDSMAALQKGMAQLPQELREALILVSLDGLSYQEAAEVTGAPVGTMKTRVFRARKGLVEILRKAGTLELMQG